MSRRRKKAAAAKPKRRAAAARRAAAPSARKSVIITFKRKDQRADRRTDKLELFAESVSAHVHFTNAAALARGASLAPMGGDEIRGFEVNEYEAPILAAALTATEIAALRRNPNVESVEDDGFCYALPVLAPENFVFEAQPPSSAETVPAGVRQIKAPAAWDCSRGKAIKVAVLDTGIDATHPDLVAHYRGGISFVDDETSPMDFNGHGTHCAGTIGAAINGSGVVGVAPAAYLYAVKILSRVGEGQWSWLIAGLDWCIQHGVRICSMSLGGASAPVALQTMCDLAWSRGLLLVAAAGNNGGAVGVPAKYDSVIAVSAIDSVNVIAGFSSRGREVELCAPGVDVLSTLPGGGHSRMSGTSMACPHVSGAAALAWGAHRYADNITIRRLLATTADNLGNPGRDSLYGFGRVDAGQAASALKPPKAVTGLP